jgi:hypothetical protein
MLNRKGASKLVVSVVALVTVVPMAMSQARVTSAISAQHVADAMVSAGITVNPGQIELLSGVSAAREGASMRVVSVTHRTGGTVKVKLRCRENYECLPFYVLVHGLDRVNERHSKTAAVPAVAATSPKDMIRGGDHAILILETPDSRMRFPVICLQSGVLGQRIRAASPDRKQFYEAEVVAAGILKGKL